MENLQLREEMMNSIADYKKQLSTLEEQYQAQLSSLARQKDQEAQVGEKDMQ